MIILIVIKSDITNIKPSPFIININKIIRFINVGRFLHITALIGIILFSLGISSVNNLFFRGDEVIPVLFWIFLTLFGISLFIFAELDAMGRYQNYKQVKEKIYKYGYKERLIKLYMYSNCQRDAVFFAAKDLNYHKQVKNFFFIKGYRWYHILPDAFINNPLILFKKTFWYNILFTDYYRLHNFYW